MTARTATAGEFILALWGPIVWAAYFLAYYGLSGLVCAPPVSPRSDAALRGVGLGLSAAAAILILGFTIWRGARLAHLDAADRDNQPFLFEISIALALLSLLAVIWNAIPVWMFSACEGTH